jgi:nitric oxide dioxygenase
MERGSASNQVAATSIPAHIARGIAKAVIMPVNDHQRLNIFEERTMGLNVELLQSSFDRVKPEASTFTARFYELIFTDYPALQPLFAHTDMAEQRQKLLQSLVLVIENLREPEVLDRSLKGLGTRHVKYGVLPAHYPPIGQCLIKALQETAGAAWTPEMQQAWIEAYGAVTALMLDGANYPPEVLQIDPNAI